MTTQAYLDKFQGSESILKRQGLDLARGDAYDPHDDMLRVKSMQKKWRAGFTGNALSRKRWDVVQMGEGQTLTVSAGELQITTGTTPLAETIIMTKEVFTIPMRCMAHIKLSQRIINQEFYVELVSINPMTGLPDEHSVCGWLLDGATATQAKYLVNGGDQPILLSAAVTATTAATPGAIFELEPTADEAWFFTRTLDATTARAVSYCRNSQIPDPNRLYKFRIRIKNLATAPASSTTFGSQFINISDYAELTAEITAGRGSAVAAQAMAVAVTTLPTLSTVTTVTTSNVQSKGLWFLESSTNLGAGATYTGANRTVGSATGTLYSKIRVRVFASHPGILSIFQSRTTTAGDFRCPDGHSITIEAGQCVVLEVPVMAFYASIRFTNTGAATQTAFECVSTLVGVS